MNCRRSDADNLGMAVVRPAGIHEPGNVSVSDWEGLKTVRVVSNWRYGSSR